MKIFKNIRSIRLDYSTPVGRRWYILLLLLVLLIYSTPMALHRMGVYAPAMHMVQEDGPVETAGALFCLLGSAIFLTAYFRFPIRDSSCRTTRRNHFLLLLSLFLIFLFGEEISWGQRVLNLEIYRHMADISFQQEFNLHNLKIVQKSNNQFATYGAKLLLIYLTFPAFALALFPSYRRKLRLTNMPFTSLWVSFITVVNYLLLKSIKGLFDIPPFYALGIFEIFEMNLELILLVFAVETYMICKRKTKPDGLS